MNVKTRFSPSPTGYLHIGSLRTALYNYLFARKHDGVFLLRIEDTDQERVVEGAMESLIRTLERMGLSYEEGPVLQNGKLGEKGGNGPYIQSKRLAIYQQHARELVESTHAYYCFCSQERVEELRMRQQQAKLPTKYDRHCLAIDPVQAKKRVDEGEAHVIRLRIPEGETTFRDEIRGSITIQNTEIDDQILLKSDGFPTYHLAVVVDDHLMGVTHVIRGEEWISSVPKHVILYTAFGFPLPLFAHLPLILNPDRSKLSKRQADVAVEDYLSNGYLPEALLNFVALLGCNPTGEREIYTISELIDAFDLSRINKSGAIFDRKKLDWMNGRYIRAADLEALLRLADPFFGEASGLSQELKKQILMVERDRLTTLGDLEHHARIYTKPEAYDAELLIWKKSNHKNTVMHLNDLLKLLRDANPQVFHDRVLMETLIKKYIIDNGYQNGDVLWPLRVALSGQQQSANPFELLWVLGKTEGLYRIEQAIHKFLDRTGA